MQFGADLLGPGQGGQLRLVVGVDVEVELLAGPLLLGDRPSARRRPPPLLDEQTQDAPVPWAVPAPDTGHDVERPDHRQLLGGRS